MEDLEEKVIDEKAKQQRDKWNAARAEVNVISKYLLYLRRSASLFFFNQTKKSLSDKFLGAVQGRLG